ncbi:MAG: hypothetical protein M1821_004970 [Bathelium mastoideum]|nr:MAG: hypothetical protein M1821_004970 [Bathelium mastoideum]
MANTGNGLEGDEAKRILVESTPMPPQLAGEANSLPHEELNEKSASPDPSSEDDAPQQSPPPTTTGLKLALTIVGLCLSVFCVALDNTIIATAIPRITDQFHAIQDVGWYGSAYLLTTCAFQLFFGKLYYLFNIKYTFLVALFIFELGSLIAAVAPTSVALIVGRAIAGVGSAGLFAGALIIIAFTTPLDKRPMYQGMLGGMYGIASVVGPLWGGTTYAWSNGRIIALFIIWALAMIAFVGVQIWMGESATVPPRIGAQRTVASASVFALCLGGAFYLLIYFLPIWFQAVKGTDALRSGVDTIPLILSNTFGVFFSGGLSTAFGHYMPYVYLCVLLTSVGSGLLTLLNPSTSTGRWIGYQILYGFGCGCAFQLPQIAAQAVLPQQDVPVGVAITLFATMLGGSLFVSTGNNVLNNGLVKNLSALKIPNLNPQDIVDIGATELRSSVPSQFIVPAVQAYNSAVTKTFQVALILSCLSVLGAAGMEWRSVKAPKKAELPEDKDSA